MWPPRHAIGRSTCPLCPLPLPSCAPAGVPDAESWLLQVLGTLKNSGVVGPLMSVDPLVLLMKRNQDCEEPCRSRCFKISLAVGCEISTTTYSMYRLPTTLQECCCCSEISSASGWSLEAARAIKLAAALISKSRQTLLLRGSDAYCSPRRSPETLEKLQINVEQYPGQMVGLPMWGVFVSCCAPLYHCPETAQIEHMI